MTEQLQISRGRGRPRVELSDEQRNALVAALDADVPWKELVERFGISRTSLWRLVGPRGFLKQNS